MNEPHEPKLTAFEVAHPLDAINNESVREQSIRSWLDRLRASALYQHEVPHGSR